jgi:hypothetical protein
LAKEREIKMELWPAAPPGPGPLYAAVLSLKYLLVGSAKEKRLLFADDYYRKNQ